MKNTVLCYGCKKWFPVLETIDGFCAECYSKAQAQILTTALGEEFIADMERDEEPFSDQSGDDHLRHICNEARRLK